MAKKTAEDAPYSQVLEWLRPIGQTISKELEKQVAAAKPYVAQAEVDVRGWVEDFLTEWYVGAVNAKDAVPDPPAPQSRADFFIALAGNLVWAATCFLPEVKA